MRTYKKAKPVGIAPADMSANVPTRMIASGNAIDPNPEAALDPAAIVQREIAANSR